MANYDLSGIYNQMDQELAQTPEGRDWLAKKQQAMSDSARQQMLVENELAANEPFYQTPEQAKFLDYLNAQMYSPNVEREAYAELLRSRMMGSDGSIAQAQLAQKMNENALAGASAMGTNRGVINPALIAKQVSGIASTGGQKDIGQAASNRAEEAQRGMGLFGAEAQAAAQQKLKEQQFYAEQLAQERQANIDRARFLSGVSSEQERSRDIAEARESQRKANIISGLGQGLTTLGAAYIGSQKGSTPSKTYTPMDLSKTGSSALKMPSDTTSDIKLKDNIASGDSKMQAFLDSMQPYSYNYKNPQQDDSFDHLGVMAQDVEKTPIGKTMVTEGERGKMLKPDLSTILAAAAYNNKRIKELESRMPASVPSVKEMPSDLNIPRTINQEDLLVNEGYNIGGLPIKVPEHEKPYSGINKEGRIVERIPEIYTGKYLPVNMPQTIQPAPEDMKKVADYLDMMDNMKRTTVPMPEKFKRTKTK